MWDVFRHSWEFPPPNNFLVFLVSLQFLLILFVTHTHSHTHTHTTTPSLSLLSFSLPTCSHISCPNISPSCSPLSLPSSSSLVTPHLLLWQFSTISFSISSFLPPQKNTRYCPKYLSASLDFLPHFFLF